MRTAHPAFHQVGESERLEHLAHSGEFTLRTDDTNRVVLAHIPACDESQLLCRGDGSDSASLTAVNRLHTIASGCAYEHQHVIDFLGSLERDLHALHDIVYLENEPLVHIGGDDQPDGC